MPLKYHKEQHCYKNENKKSFCKYNKHDQKTVIPHNKSSLNFSPKSQKAGQRQTKFYKNDKHAVFIVFLKKGNRYIFHLDK